MAIHPGARSESRAESPLERLVRARGLKRFALFFVTGEGEYLPNGEEEQSGYVIDEQGQTYSFWTGWDDQVGEVTFTEWEPVTAEPEWSGVDEYERALATVAARPANGETH